MTNLLFLLLLLHLNIMPGLLYERKCSYIMGTQIISCENSVTSIKDVTDLIEKDTNVVMIKGGHELRITRTCHRQEGCKHISTYQISRIDDLEIEPDGFAGLTNLLHLKIIDNGLYKLENRVFYGLGKLQRLDLTNCSIESVQDATFEGLRSLESLDLANNEIKSITPKTFKDLSSLASLILYDNKIEKLELDSFSSLVNLNDLDLSNNQLKRVDARVFNKIPQLTYLYLSFNQIEVITGNLQCPMLKFLYVKQNKLKEVREKLLDSSSNLIDIDLSYNNIDKIHRRAFSNLKSLMNLNLKNNTAINVDELIFGS
ncbi:hypothetical protein AMK59_524, partial [Oryctes borbonicus]